jgi:hypothetical protein
MKTLKYIFIAVTGAFLLTALVLSCKKSATPFKAYTFDATIKDTGNPAADGCDWQLIADSTYHPTNLDAQYKVNGMKVTVTFHKPGPRYFCNGGGAAAIINTNGPSFGGYSDIVIDQIVAKP